RIVVMKSGVIQQVGTPEELYETPANLFVAGFIGSPAMNFLPVTAKGGALELGNGHSLAGASVAAFDALQRSEARTVILGIRPEHLILAPEAPAPLRVRVDLVEPLGSDTLIHFTLAGTPAVARVSPDLRLKPGDE